MQFLATAAFGLEGPVARELRALGYEAQAINGGALFEGTMNDAYTANLSLRMADRVLLIVSSFTAKTFEELFNGITAIPWEDYLNKNSAFPITGNCARSQLMSVRDCQAIAKKAVVSRLSKLYKIEWLPENGDTIPISVTLHADVVRVAIDTSGQALNRRGYRTWNGEAPIRETLAAALVALSPWKPGIPLHDPFCGTGTILIEAAMQASHFSPGLNRAFAMEGFHFCRNVPFKKIRDHLFHTYRPDAIQQISGSDLDPDALSLARRHLKQVGFNAHISLDCMDVDVCIRPETNGVFICNPPYGERLNTKAQCENIYRKIRKLYDRHPGWALCVICSYPLFEKVFGRRADKKRRFYNGRIECEYMIYFPRQTIAPQPSFR